MRLWRRKRGAAPFPEALNVERMGQQCPTCGSPVNVMWSKIWVPGPIRLDPCGHEVDADALLA